MNEQQVNALIDSLAMQIGRQSVDIAQRDVEIATLRQQLSQRDAVDGLAEKDEPEADDES